jgi:signal transduction histidine kinase
MRLPDFIQANSGRIVEEWERFARVSDPTTSGMSTLMLRDDIEPILAAVARDMRQSQSPAQRAKKAQSLGTEGELGLAGQGHATQRLDIGFRFNQTAAEFRALRASVVRLWEATGPAPTATNRNDLVRFNEAIDQVLLESMNEYTRRLDHYRDQFLAILGHDLRTPLGAILMSAETMSRAGSLDAQRTQTTATRILNSARRMHRLMSDLLDLTRTRLGVGLPLEPSPLDLGEVCQQVLDELATFHPDSTLTFEPTGDLHGEWDHERLAQVISNLVGNALQHGNEKAPIRVSAAAEDDQVVLAVHNEGTPIPPEAMGRIFDPLIHGEDQAKASTSLGLGLYIVRQIVTAHGGTITVASSTGEGTTFTVRLPSHLPSKVA